MKIFFFAVLIVCGVFVISCSDNSKTDTGSKRSSNSEAATKPPFNPSSDTLSVDSAMVYIANYGTYCKAYFSYMATPPTRAFLVDSSDLVSVLGIKSFGSVNMVRIYVGLKANAATLDTNFHLFIVPISRANSNPKTQYFADSIPYAANGKQFVYDLTTPCPKTCDSFSKLYMAFADTSLSNIKWPAR